MFARILAVIGLILAVVLSTGCAHRVTTTVGPDGTRSTTSETRWTPSVPIYVAPSYRYGHDNYNRGYYRQGVAPVIIYVPNGRRGVMPVPTCFPGERNSPPESDGLCYR